MVHVSNRVGCSGAKEIADAIQNSSLTSLSLRNVRMSCKGIGEIARALEGSSLDSLDTSHNYIGSEGAIEIAAALVLARSPLTKLHLENSHIEYAGCKMIMLELAQANIAELHLGTNGNDSYKQQTLIELLRGTNVTTFSIESSPEMRITMEEIIRENKQRLDLRRFSSTKAICCDSS